MRQRVINKLRDYIAELKGSGPCTIEMAHKIYRGAEIREKEPHSVIEIA